MRVSPVIARIKRKSAPRRFMSAKVHRGLRPKKAQDLKNYFGTGALGDVVISTNTNLTATLDGAPVVRHYNSLTINSGVTLTTDNRCKGLVIYVRGDCTINGTLTMSGKGAQAAPTRDLSIYRAPAWGYAYSSGTPDVENLPDETLAICKSGVGRKVYRSAHNTPELMGTTGLAATRTYYGGHYGFGGVSYPPTTPGWPGNEAPGGGGGGNGGGSMTPPYTAYPTVGGFDGYDVNHPSTGWVNGGRPGARGGNGAAFSGGPGGGGGGLDSENSDPTPGNLNGGGPGGTGGSNSGGNGASGGGGVIFLIVGGSLTIGPSGTISSDGTAASGVQNGGGGGSGGGRLIVLYAKNFSNSGVIRANGGLGGSSVTAAWMEGAAGGPGAITVERIKAA